ncbi:cation diffusion facilitator family transporter [Geothermobacter ehrlichii]|uniref:Cation diffusion facilitator family transporter n=1 Tax=Geothermobacter ehrlichii TaxID=213224 RepID=A0A5D3WMH5_9BACT|nr:cation diffusion facilitator family transporter [Geothermobacter ehrlichii]TYO99699.1 cation diffusion facilitator family transporter [Geothermobacter ehrlichii]
MKHARRKIRAARLAVLTASSLAVAKLVTGLLTGSLAVLASALDSVLDIIMSGVNYFAIHHASQPADENHPFGHGKFETVATLIQSSAIAGTGILIGYESVRRLLNGVELVRLENGMIVLLVSAVASVAISRHLRRVAAECDSSALKADSLHFAMDVYTNLALLLGLILVTAFDAPWIDPLLSLLAAFYILFEAFKLLRHGMRDVLDEELPQPMRDEIRQLIEKHQGVMASYHNLRTRRAGSQKMMDFHLTVCRHLTIEEAHDIADLLEERIRSEIPGADVTIHIEPCSVDRCPGADACREDRMRLEIADDNAQQQAP